MNVASLFAKATASQALAASVQPAPAATPAPSIGTLQASAWAAPVTDAVKTISPAPRQAVEVTRAAAPVPMGSSVVARAFAAIAAPAAVTDYGSAVPVYQPWGGSIFQTKPDAYTGMQPQVAAALGVNPATMEEAALQALNARYRLYSKPDGDYRHWTLTDLGGRVLTTFTTYVEPFSLVKDVIAPAIVVFGGGALAGSALAGAGVGVEAGSAAVVDSAIGGTGLTATAGNGLTLAAETGAGAGLTATPGLGLTLAAPTGTGAGLALTTGQATFAASVGASVAAWDAAAAAAALPTSASTALAPASVDSAIGGTGLTATPGQGLTLAEATGTGTGLTATAGQGLTLAEATGTGAGFTLAQAVNAVKTIPVVKGLVDAVTGVSAAPGATQGQVQAKPVTQAAAPLLLLAAAAGAFLLIRK